MKIQKLTPQKITSFLKECKAFIFVTKNNLYPASRPFGAVIYNKEFLYMPTNRTKQVYKQVIKDKHAQILALKPGTREWIRVTGNVSTCMDLSLKKKMWKNFPILAKRYQKVEDSNFVLLKFKIIKIEYFNN